MKPLAPRKSEIFAFTWSYSKTVLGKMCTTRHTLEPCLKLKTVPRQVSLLSLWASWLPRFHTDGVVWLWIPKVLRHSSDRQSLQILLGQTWRTHCAQLPHQRSSLLFCSLVRWTAFLFSLQKKKYNLSSKTFLSSECTKYLAWLA